MSVSGMKTYRNKSGYEIQATEKAYHLFYEKQGFKLVDNQKEETKVDTGETAPYETEGGTWDTAAEESTGVPSKEVAEETGDKLVTKGRKTPKKNE